MRRSLCQSISQLDSDDAFFEFCSSFIKHTDRKTMQEWMIKTIMSKQSPITNDSLKPLLNRATNIVKKENKTQEFNDNQSNTESKANDEKKKANLTTIPRDLFNHIGCHLDLIASLRVSMCNHILHETVLNSQYFDQCQDTKVLTLTKRKLAIILKNNNNLQHIIYIKLQIFTNRIIM